MFTHRRSCERTVRSRRLRCQRAEGTRGPSTRHPGAEAVPRAHPHHDRPQQHLTTSLATLEQHHDNRHARVLDRLRIPGAVKRTIAPRCCVSGCPAEPFDDPLGDIVDAALVRHGEVLDADAGRVGEPLLRARQIVTMSVVGSASRRRATTSTGTMSRRTRNGSPDAARTSWRSA
jgi:hypothetical protein